jgi:hypothetical protein
MRLVDGAGTGGLATNSGSRKSVGRRAVVEEGGQANGRRKRDYFNGASAKQEKRFMTRGLLSRQCSAFLLSEETLVAATEALFGTKEVGDSQGANQRESVRQ